MSPAAQVERFKKELGQSWQEKTEHVAILVSYKYCYKYFI